MKPLWNKGEMGVVLLLAGYVAVVTTRGNGQFGLGNMEVLQVDLARRFAFSFEYLQTLSETRRGPLWTVVLYAWQRVFFDADLTLRAASSVAFLAGLVGSFLLTRQVLSLHARVLSTGWIATGGMVVEYGRDARAYAAHFALVVAALLALHRLFERRTTRDGISLFLLVNLAVANHFVAGIFLLPMGLCAVLLWAKNPVKKWGKSGEGVGAFSGRTGAEITVVGETARHGEPGGHEPANFYPLGWLFAAGVTSLFWLAMFRAQFAVPDLDLRPASWTWVRDLATTLFSAGSFLQVTPLLVLLVLSATVVVLRGGESARLAWLCVATMVGSVVVAALVAVTDFRATSPEYFLPVIGAAALLLALAGEQVSRPLATTAWLVLIALNLPGVTRIVTRDYDVWGARERGFVVEVAPHLHELYDAAEGHGGRVLVLPFYAADVFSHYADKREAAARVVPQLAYVGVAQDNVGEVATGSYCFVVFEPRMGAALFHGARNALIEAVVKSAATRRIETAHETLLVGCVRGG